MRALAKLVSLLLHPLWMPTALVALCFLFDAHLSFNFAPLGVWIIVAMVFIMTGIFPLTSALLMLRSGMIGDLTMPLRQERIPVYMLSLIYYGMGYWLLRRTPNHPELLSLFFGGALALLFTLLITLRWKISAHMVGIGGVLGAIIAIQLLHGAPVVALIALLLLLTGALGSARLLISDHTPAQVYMGALLGLLLVLGCGLVGLAP